MLTHAPNSPAEPAAPGPRRILVIEDDRHIAEGLKLNLELQEFAVRIAADGVEGLADWKQWRPHLIVLDIMLPGIDGLSVLKTIRREDERLPILILSAKTAPDDKVRGLAYGVDDYLSKPFNLEEFLLRVERLMTRSSWYDDNHGDSAAGHRSSSQTYVFGHNRIDFTAAVAQGPSGRIDLTPQEIKLLKLFVANRGRPLARSQLLEIGWGYTRGMSTRTVDNFIVRFRKYFEENPKNPVYFKSRRGIGYVFDHEDER